MVAAYRGSVGIMLSRRAAILLNLNLENEVKNRRKYHHKTVLESAAGGDNFVYSNLTIIIDTRFEDKFLTWIKKISRNQKKCFIGSPVAIPLM